MLSQEEKGRWDILMIVVLPLHFGPVECHRFPCRCCFMIINLKYDKKTMENNEAKEPQRLGWDPDFAHFIYTPCCGQIGRTGHHPLHVGLIRFLTVLYPHHKDKGTSHHLFELIAEIHFSILPSFLPSVLPSIARFLALSLTLRIYDLLHLRHNLW